MVTMGCCVFLREELSQAQGSPHGESRELWAHICERFSWAGRPCPSPVFSRGEREDWGPQTCSYSVHLPMGSSQGCLGPQ